MGVTNKIVDFFKGVLSELKKVNWPTRRETIYLTLIVIVSTGIATALFSGIDWALSKALELIVSKG